jgi:glycosyltransferase involved in cell wall biosynthesis
MASKARGGKKVVGIFLYRYYCPHYGGAFKKDMKVLMITGDKNVLVPGTGAHARYLLQKAQVDALDAMFWGRGALTAPFFVQGKYDVVTSQDPFWRGLVAWVVARRLGAKLNIQVHTDLMEQPLIRHVLSQIVLGHAHSVRVVSEKLKKQVERLSLGVPIHVLPVFVDVARFRNLERTHHPHFTKVILWIGRLEQEKNPAEALEVLRKVRAHGVDAGLIYLGAGSLEGSLRMQSAGQKEYVEFAGWQDPAPYLAMADVVLSTSPVESYGASIVEALAAGVLVVSYDVGIAREAGAVIASRGNLADAVLNTIQSGLRGELKLTPMAQDAWAKAWKETLI